MPGQSLSLQSVAALCLNSFELLRWEDFSSLSSKSLCSIAPSLLPDLHKDNHLLLKNGQGCYTEQVPRGSFFTAITAKPVCGKDSLDVGHHGGNPE